MCKSFLKLKCNFQFKGGYLLHSYLVAFLLRKSYKNISNNKFLSRKQLFKGK